MNPTTGAPDGVPAGVPATWVLDLDGVLWLGDQPLPGAAEAVARLRAAGHRVLFATNNSGARVATQEAKLAGFGIPAEGDVVNSAMAAAHLVEPGERVLICGGPGVVEAMQARGAVVVDDAEADRGKPVDVVVAGFTRDFDYERMRITSTAIRNGARFLATNSDVTYPTPEGLIPGGGSIVAAIAAAAEVEPEVAGKPHEPMARLIHDLVGDPATVDPERGIMVGDRPDTDGAFAVTLGYQFGLVLTGVTTPDDLPVEPAPDRVADDLAALVDGLLIT